jgi:cytochrome P450
MPQGRLTPYVKLNRVRQVGSTPGEGTTMSDQAPESRRPSSISSARWTAGLNAIELTRDPVGFFQRRAARASDPFFVRFPGLGEVLVTGTAQGAREVFTTPPEAFVPPVPNPVEPIFGPRSVALAGGSRHRRHRRLIMSCFHGPTMHAAGEVMRERVRAEVARWNIGDYLVAEDIARTITLDVVVRAVFGIRDECRVALFRRATTAMLDAFPPVLMALPWLRRRFFGVGPWAEFLRARRVFDGLLREEIAIRRRADGVDRDVLSVLLRAHDEEGAGLTDDEIIDQMATLLAAGHETTATALAWALHYVHADPRVEVALRQEIAATEATAEAWVAAPYLSAVCDEVLRLQPSVPIVLRRTTCSLCIRGVELPPGSVVAVAITLLHADEGRFPDPEEFRPERFVGTRFTGYEYAPFGGGARRCLGAALASIELRIVLGAIINQRRLSVPDAVPPRSSIHAISMAPRRPLRLVVGEEN